MDSQDVRSAYNAAVESIRGTEFPMLKGEIMAPLSAIFLSS
jgi:hypothetical protein